ncbi:hypothetical protein BASA50_002612 [Batrachochytrium salamandrivorans]|uniref:Uncharacterized protein n=1 Tax=Batrachochytrium salamandrivorans TaxID=1357716 RepID=A0ABQ8FKV0_9FUNG|nr:hypothetical protein BASA60_011523 [Batrachochytrium salamandrivorans]KAH6576977.1 hypothetical protein BASA62_001087 [Batrachochytrium salamandrivorans]KAH6581022.1 hypothetical protein BASA61_009283 [Batrachochytrium salamandrivorans]KAH6600025.1 hypothetical protein BASA50_002612 [Batrachochytrium salamandrivorans]
MAALSNSAYVSGDRTFSQQNALFLPTYTPTDLYSISALLEKDGTTYMQDVAELDTNLQLLRSSIFLQYLWNTTPFADIYAWANDTEQTGLATKLTSGLPIYMPAPQLPPASQLPPATPSSAVLSLVERISPMEIIPPVETAPIPIHSEPHYTAHLISDRNDIDAYLSAFIAPVDAQPNASLYDQAAIQELKLTKDTNGVWTYINLTTGDRFAFSRENTESDPVYLQHLSHFLYGTQLAANRPVSIVACSDN